MFVFLCTFEGASTWEELARATRATLFVSMPKVVNRPWLPLLRVPCPPEAARFFLNIKHDVVGGCLRGFRAGICIKRLPMANNAIDMHAMGKQHSNNHDLDGGAAPKDEAVMCNRSLS